MIAVDDPFPDSPVQKGGCSLESLLSLLSSSFGHGFACPTNPRTDGGTHCHVGEAPPFGLTYTFLGLASIGQSTLRFGNPG
jgi:hypothetical protein